MQLKQQILKFKRIQSHYQRVLDVMTTQLALLNKNVVRAREDLEHAESRLRATEQRLASSRTTDMNWEVGGQLLVDLNKERNDKFQQLSEASEAFNYQRSLVENESARIDSLEKLVQGKSETLAYQQRRTDQLTADEQYLQSSFPRGNQ